MNWIDNPNYLNVAGLFCDIVGALILGKAIFFNAAISISAQATPTWDDNLALRSALCEQRVDAWFGLPLLGMGFLIQLLSDFIAVSAIIAFVLGLVIIAIVAVYFATKRKLTTDLILRSRPKAG